MTEMCEPGRGTSGKTASIVICGLNLGLGMKGRMAFPPHVVKILVRDTSVTLETGKKTKHHYKKLRILQRGPVTGFL